MKKINIESTKIYYFAFVKMEKKILVVLNTSKDLNLSHWFVMVMQKGTITSDDSLAISYNIMYGFLVWSSVCTLKYLP